jgi:hypothetical protein
MGLHDGTPNHRRGGDAFPRRERSAILIDGSHKNAEACLDIKCLEGLPITGRALSPMSDLIQNAD